MLLPMKRVVLVHGLFMPSFIMSFLYHQLKQQGFMVTLFSYSTRDFEQGVRKLNREVLQGGQVYFVGHSLGGLLIRRYFEKYQPHFDDTCIVTIGTPHNGSRVARIVYYKTGTLILKKSTHILSQGLRYSGSNVVVGCIVGVKNIGLGNFFRNGKGDGMVLIEEAILKGAKDVCYVHYSHTAMLYCKPVAQQVVQFINTRQFIH